MADKTTARERLLKAASELFHNDGIVASGIDTQNEEAERLIREALQELLPHDGPRAADLAEHLSFLFEGALMRAGLERHDARLRSARRKAEHLLRQL